MERLFTPIRIGSIALKNQFIMAPPTRFES